MRAFSSGWPRPAGALLWLHTHAQRFFGKGRRKAQIPRGAARCTKAVSEKPEEYPDTFDYEPGARLLTVGAGRFEPVEPEVYAFDVSGLKVVQSWLGYRMRAGKGRKLLSLDDIRPERWTAQFTTELLELLWVLEATLAFTPTRLNYLPRCYKVICFPPTPCPPRLSTCAVLKGGISSCFPKRLTRPPPTGKRPTERGPRTPAPATPWLGGPAR